MFNKNVVTLLVRHFRNSMVAVTPDAIRDSDSEPDIQEVDWSVAGPVLHQHVSDLQRLQTLNKATSTLIRRIRTLAVKKSLNKCEYLFSIFYYVLELKENDLFKLNMISILI